MATKRKTTASKKRLFHVGDRVRITRKAQANERGWDNSWVAEMNKAVGQIGTIVAISIEFAPDIEVDVPGIWTYGYPDFVLKLVRKKK